MSVALFAHDLREEGLTVVEQKVIDWTCEQAGLL